MQVSRRSFTHCRRSLSTNCDGKAAMALKLKFAAGSYTHGDWLVRPQGGTMTRRGDRAASHVRYAKWRRLAENLPVRSIEVSRELTHVADCRSQKRALASYRATYPRQRRPGAANRPAVAAVAVNGRRYLVNSVTQTSALMPWLPWAAGIALLSFSALLGYVAFGKRRNRIEDPSRLTAFFAVVSALDWAGDAAARSLDELSAATTALFQAEVTYYYRARQARRRASSLFRWAAFLSATAGLACPFLETAVPSWAGISRFGYVLLAIAAASLAGNELFGGTRGHIRSVTAQYELERLLNRFVIDWSEWRSDPAMAGDRKKGFDILRGLSDGVYTELLDETREWGTAISEAEKAYGAGVSSRTGGPSASSTGRIE